MPAGDAAVGGDAQIAGCTGQQRHRLRELPELRPPAAVQFLGLDRQLPPDLSMSCTATV